jgi:hypothetical protein
MKFSRIRIILFFKYPLLIDWVSEWLLLNANSANFQLCYGENKLIVKGGLLSYCDKVYSGGNINQKHRIGGVMVTVLASSAVNRVFEPRSSQTKDYAIGICCFSAKRAALRRKSKDWLARDQNNACNIVVILLESSFVEQVEEYTCLNTDSSEILVSNIKYIIHNFLHLSE